ncbi:NO-inducible flavohemoprotein [Aureispira anguillae]|uniref:Flavohemoprotein n=1 Tax=Aureispira anguillae TaxID=2864201 RepID=A0A915YIF8_9BACT|nr:NO-inducible flavohemoprotein [Aureispira anguillae]BDS13561.1 NO-inducible flavohemoprotein [Aureispira anguillae]
MITAKTIEIVKSTAPVLAAHGEQITTVFYKRMFKNHPELKDIFNMTHQKQGTQPKVLANAVYQYAQHIDRLEVLGAAVESIAQKHVSLAITPEMYPIVGENLLAAIGEVLGEAATPEIVEAWTEAYQALADILINREEELYVDGEESTGGFRGKKEFEVIKKVQESSVITSFYLKRKDGTAIPEFKSGQYVSIMLDIPNTDHKHSRNYSLSDCNCKDYLRISVKREAATPEGIVSNYLHKNIGEGDSLWIGMPAGEFILEEGEQPVVLLAGGVGITPLMSMYKHLVNKTDRTVSFVQCALNSEMHAFKNEIKEHSNNNVTAITVYDQPLEADALGESHDFEGYLTLDILKTIPNLKDSAFYFCGPKPFMAATLNLLKQLEIEDDNIHYEFFGPAEELMLMEEAAV